MGKGSSTSIKFALNYPMLIFRQIDRIMRIMVVPPLDLNVLRRGLDGLLGLVSFSTDEKIKVPTFDPRDSPEEVYAKCQGVFHVIIRICEKEGILGFNKNIDYEMDTSDFNG